ncbi:Endonuclease/exonuclease/phosphatase [Penicillium expansum]|uniref:Endonuclease/exonuclease/phosphatase n=1 Tax=Penicillium expansum TaxID=27334 RepID=A0A0A2K6Q9_PENEN|nr:Endonuclease/exonuclease/phosphatase [Penicillium expansum]KGO39761.1 Endonuclease/exonuclease/phosphatase [Penicillium expansum]KGO62543.1 Endonuclease/exonuclease/phosphatase [Penicillium expansum]
MLFRSILFAALSGLPLVAPAALPKHGSSFELVDGPFFTFHYKTDQPSEKNWIGIYSIYGEGPGKENSIYWDWMRESEETKRIDDAHFNWGAYKAYFLADSGYTVLAGPIDIFLSGDGPISFNVKEFTTKNAREGKKFEARVNGLLHHAPDPNTKYSKENSDADWVSVSEDGIISGIPSGSGSSKITIRATASDKSTATIDVTVPVVASGKPLVTELKVLSLNLWYGGTKVNDYNRKQISAIANSGADIVGLQESTHGHATQIADALGWQSWQGGDSSIISRYPISKKYGAVTETSVAVRVALDGDNNQIILHNCHPYAYPYGPYDPCFDGKGADAIMDTERRASRARQIQDIVGAMTDALDNADKVPVLLTGDFNAPSHLDWTDATNSSHCGIGQFDWPTSKVPIDAGLTDAYRELHSDPAADPANTWSPIYLNNDDYNGHKEPMDRIDFVYYKGNLTPKKAETYMVGNPKPEPDHSDNEWPTDHKGVLVTFKILTQPKIQIHGVLSSRPSAF